MKKYNSRGGYRGRSYNSRRPRRSGGYRRNSGTTKFIPHSKYVAKADEGYEPPSIYAEDQFYKDFNLSEVLKNNIEAKGYVHPTIIQAQSIPVISQGQDILGLASTGSGKTNAFLIPMIDKVIRVNNQKCLIIVPTRELAQQIQAEFKALVRGTRVYSTLVIGGTSINAQIGQLRRNPQFVIGTPGRLEDLTKRGALHLNEFNNIVLDEVDRMLDMGFIPVIRFLISKLTDTKQSMFFSATMTSEAEQIANTILKNPVKVQVAKEEAHKNVHQDIIPVPTHADKLEKLHELLTTSELEKVLVFSRTKHGADKLSRRLSQQGHRVDAIHGGKTQNRRTRVLDAFRANKINILVATDVAARGLDIKGVSHVINYDEPENYKDYIHRIGRTGRAGKAGNAFTFVIQPGMQVNQ